MSHSKELDVPGEPFGTTAFISYIMSQVSLPYRRQTTKEIVRQRGSLVVKYVATGKALPYGKYPRLMEMYACTMIKRGDPSFHPDTRVLDLGSSFREFLKMLNVPVGGRQLRTIKPQLENYFSTAIAISNNTSRETEMAGFTIATKVHIEWLDDKAPIGRGVAHNWVRFSQEYIDYLKDKPVPVDLPTVAKLSSPMALDVYWWLTKRYYKMHDRVDITWQQLYDQFGSDSEMKEFRRRFKRSVAAVLEVYPQARITCGANYVTLWPSETSVPTVSQVRRVEKSAEKRREAPARPAERRESPREDVEARWIEVRGWGNVWMTSELFDVGQARAHLEGAVDPVSCPVCAYDERNRALHGYMQESLF